ncbi:MAG TPA: hypothetical protein VFT50_05555 [Baekduia sp.]|nr:hypothetical protein [Baekduia sp.]
MPARRLLLPCLAAATVAGCGGSGAPAPPAATVHAWDVRAPYLPPPDPATLPRDAPAATNRRASHAASPGDAGAAGRTAFDAGPSPAAGAPTDAQVAADLREAYGGAAGDDLDRAAIDADGLAVIPSTAPARLVALMQGANEVARKPYVYGGGHGRNADEIWTDTAYDCSGSVSYALAAAGYLDGPVDSTTLMSFGRPGPGRWVTIYANGGHTFMVVAGLRFDTSGRQVTGTRWQPADGRSYAGFVVRHPLGL